MQEYMYTYIYRRCYENCHVQIVRSGLHSSLVDAHKEQERLDVSKTNCAYAFADCNNTTKANRTKRIRTLCTYTCSYVSFVYFSVLDLNKEWVEIERQREREREIERTSLSFEKQCTKERFVLLSEFIQRLIVEESWISMQVPESSTLTAFISKFSGSQLSFCELKIQYLMYLKHIIQGKVRIDALHGYVACMGEL